MGIKRIWVPLLVTAKIAAAAQVPPFMFNSQFVGCELSVTANCSTPFDSDQLVVNNAQNANMPSTFTVSGKDNGTGSFTRILNPISRSAAITGTQIINGVTTPIDCTVFSSGQISGQCGILQQAFTAPPAAVTEAAASATAAAQGVVRSQAQTVTTIVSDRVRAISRDVARSVAPGPTGQAPMSRFSGTGMSAGSPAARWGVWGDASGAFLRDDAAVGYDGNSVVALAGLDYLYDKSWLVGVTAGYLHGDLTLNATHGPRVSDGGAFGPYLSYIFGPNASADAQMQYARLSNSVTAPLAGLHANFGSNRVTGAVNLNLYKDRGPWRLTGYTGYAYTWEGAEHSILNDVPPYSPNTRYGAFKLGGEAGYLATPRLEAYVPATLRVETTKPTDETSRVSLEIGAGLRYRLADALKAGLEATTVQIKSHYRDVRVGANLRWTF
jgi:hypothetical protein